MTGILLSGIEALIVRSFSTSSTSSAVTQVELAEYNEPGELWIRGPNVTLGYWGNEKATRETFVVMELDDNRPKGVDGLSGRWLRTGDKFRADERGRFLWAIFVCHLYRMYHANCKLYFPATSIDSRIPSKSRDNKSPPMKSRTRSSTIPPSSSLTSL